MKKILIIALFSLLGINSLQAQDTHTEEEKKAILEKAKQQLAKYQNRTTIEKGSTEYNNCYTRLHALYSKMVASTGHEHEIYLRKSFDKKLNQKIEYNLYIEQYAFFTWIDQNINSTQFRNAEAAKEDWLRIREAGKNTIANNPEYYHYITELSLTYENFSDILVDVTVAVTNELNKK